MIALCCVVEVAWAAHTPTGVAAQLLPHTEERIASGEEFGRPQALRVGPDGRLYAITPRERLLVRLASPDATPERIRLAHLGSDAVSSVLGWRGDTLWIASPDGARVRLLDEGGRVARTVSSNLPGRTGDHRGRRFVALLDGDRFLTETAASGGLFAIAMGDPLFPGVPEGTPMPAVPIAPVRELPYWIVDATGQILDTVVTVPTAHWASIAFPAEIRLETGATPYRMREQAFSDRTLHAVDPTGTRLVIAAQNVEDAGDPPHYRIVELSPTGDTLAVHAVPYDPVPIDDAWVQEAAYELGRGLSEDPVEWVRIGRSGIHVPAHMPPVSEMQVGPSGWTWVARERLPHQDRRRWDILNPEGTRVGWITLPEALAVRAVSGLEAWATVPDDQDRLALWLVRAELGDFR